MATTNPSVAHAVSSAPQELYTISYPYLDTHQYTIKGVSKADPAVVSVTLSNTPLISTTGTVGTIAGSDPWTAKITGMTTTKGLQTGMIITATDGTGTIGTGEVQVTSIVGNTSITIKAVGGLTPGAGNVTNISIPADGFLPQNLVDGTAILINGVAGMTQLKTAGDSGTNKYFVSNATASTFELTGVDSTGFSTATANTGFFQTFSVPQYNTAGTIVNVVFSDVGPIIGSDIDVNSNTGVISVVGGDNVYSFYATATVTGAAGATYQFYDLTSDVPLGIAVPAGTPLTFMWTPADDADVCLRLTAADGTEFMYPAQITNSQLNVEVVSGFVA